MGGSLLGGRRLYIAPCHMAHVGIGPNDHREDTRRHATILSIPCSEWSQTIKLILSTIEVYEFKNGKVTFKKNTAAHNHDGFLDQSPLFLAKENFCA